MPFCWFCHEAAHLSHKSVFGHQHQTNHVWYANKGLEVMFNNKGLKLVSLQSPEPTAEGVIWDQPPNTAT